jgi:thymidylate synthase
MSVRYEFRKLYHETIASILQMGEKACPRGTVTREIRHWPMISGDHSKPLILIPGRNINYAFAIRELIWMLNGSNLLAQLIPYNPRMQRWSDDGQVLHGAYGPRMRRWEVNGLREEQVDWVKKGSMRGDAEPTVDQLRAAIMTLKLDRDSRQAVVSIWNPEKDAIYKTKDLPCNTQLMFLVRDNKLENDGHPTEQ